MSPARWYETHFADSGMGLVPLARLLEPVADAMGCHITQLRADDSFQGTLKYRGTSFLRLYDDDPLEGYAVFDLPRLLGGTERTGATLKAIRADPTLLALASAITASGGLSPGRCPWCRYDLTGLSNAEKCPECGRGVGA